MWCEWVVCGLFNWKVRENKIRALNGRWSYTKRKHQQNTICNWNDDLQQSRQQWFFVLLFWNECVTRWMGFLYSQNLMTLTTFFVGLFVCLLCRSPIFSSRRRFLLLSSSMSIVLDFYVFILHEKARWQLMDYWMNHASVCMCVVLCMDVLGWLKTIDMRKTIFWMTEKSQYIFIISFQIVYYLVSWEYLILLYCIVICNNAISKRRRKKNETTFALSLAFTLYQFVKLIAIYEKKREIVKNLGEKL